MDDAAVSLLRKVSERKPLTEDECVYLLGFPEDSPEADMTVRFADRLSRIANDNTGEIGAQIGIITGPCIADCGFCKYAVGTTDADDFVMSDDTLRDYIGRITEHGDVTVISLMTIHSFDFEDLLGAVRVAREEAPEDVVIAVNTGDLTRQQCISLRNAGVGRAYHAIRLGEGDVTRLNPFDRLETVRNLMSASIGVVTCTEPVGPEDSAREIVRSYLGSEKEGFIHGSVAKRVPVPGTRMGGCGEVSDRRLMHIASVLLLSTAWKADVSAPVGYYGGFYGGFGKVYAEYAGNPRDPKDYSEKSEGKTVGWARRKLFEDGYSKIRKADGSTVPLDRDYLRMTGSL